MNCLHITLFFNIVAAIVQTFIKSWNQLLYPRVVEVCRLHFEPRHDFFLHFIIVVELFSQRDVSLGEETSGNRWARGPEYTADGPIYLTRIFPEAQWGRAQNGAARCRGAGTRRVTTFPSFVFIDSSKPCQGVTVCSGISCFARRHEVDQENAFSVPEKGRHDFFH